MSWFTRNAAAIEAAAALTTALVAAAALIGVKVQLDEADRLARATTARDAYRNHLALAVTVPDFAQPDYCALSQGPKAESYEAFVGHLLYSAELMLETEEGWESVFQLEMAPHATYICSEDGPSGDTEAVARLLSSFKTILCDEVPSCS